MNVLLRISSILLVLSLASQSNAGTVFGLDNEFSDNGTAPPGAGPWAQLAFSTVGPGVVELTVKNLIASGGTGRNFISAVYFNVSQTAYPTPTALTISNVGSVLHTVIDKKASNPLNNEAFKADGDGYFDFRIDFANSVFGGGQTARFTLSAVGLTDSAFQFLSEPKNGSSTGFYAAAHVQGLGENGGLSGWIGTDILTTVVVPLPIGAWMGLSLLGGVGGVGYFRRRQQRLLA